MVKALFQVIILSKSGVCLKTTASSLREQAWISPGQGDVESHLLFHLLSLLLQSHLGKAPPALCSVPMPGRLLRTGPHLKCWGLGACKLVLGPCQCIKIGACIPYHFSTRGICLHVQCQKTGFPEAFGLLFPWMLLVGDDCPCLAGRGPSLTVHLFPSPSLGLQMGYPVT